MTKRKAKGRPRCEIRTRKISMRNKTLQTVKTRSSKRKQKLVGKSANIDKNQNEEIEWESGNGQSYNPPNRKIQKAPKKKTSLKIVSRGRPLKADVPPVQFERFEEHNQIIKLIIYFLQFVKQLGLKTIQKKSTNQMALVWNEQDDIKKIKEKLFQIYHNIDSKKIQVFNYVCANFGGRLSLEYKQEIHNVMISLLTKSCDTVVSEVLDKQKNDFPFLSFTHQESSKLQEPYLQKLPFFLKSFFEKIKQEIEQNYLYTEKKVKDQVNNQS